MQKKKRDIVFFIRDLKINKVFKDKGKEYYGLY